MKASIFVASNPTQDVYKNESFSQEKIRVLKYERFHYPCSKVQKKLQAVHLKAAQSYTNTETGRR
jgi:hypothetical protein